LFRIFNKKKLLSMTFILIMTLLLNVGLALAVVPTSATITLTVVSDKILAGKAVGVTGLDISLQDGAGYDLVLNQDYTRGTDATGVYKILGLSTGNYNLTVAQNGHKETTTVSITALGEKKVSMTYTNGLGTDSINKTKTGAISGMIFDNLTGNPVASPVKVKVVGSVSTYEVMTDSILKGHFKFYVPPGKYSIVTESTNSSYKNTISLPVNVVAGQSVTPLSDSDLMVNTVQWPSVSGVTVKTLGLTVPTILSTAKSFTGKANIGTTVTALVYSDTLGKYTFLASTVAKKGTTIVDPGVYTLTLPTVQPNKKIKVIVTDTAFNSYTDLTNDTTPTARLTLAASSLTYYLDASTSIDLKLGFTDATATFLKSVTSIVYNTNDDGLHNFPLSDTQYSTTKNSGKLTILAGSIPIGTNYNIIVKSSNFTDTKWTGVAVKSSSTVPPVIPGTLSWITGSALGTTHLSWVQPTLASQKMDTINHKLMYKVSDSDLSLATAGTNRVFLANTLADGIDYNYSQPGDIAGVLPDQWFGLYEVDKTSLRIFKFTSHKLAVKEIKGPSTVAQKVYGSTITLNFDTLLNETKIPVNTSFVVKVTPSGGTAATRSLGAGGVAISDNTVTLTLSGAPILSTDTVTLVYTAPTSNYLQDNSTRGVASTLATTPLALVNLSGAPITGLTNPLQIGKIITATAATTEPGAVSWASSAPSVATVDSISGVVTALTAGNTIISYTDSTSHHISSQAITVYASAATPTLTIDVVQLGEGNVTPTGFTAAGTGETIVWTSSDPSKASIAITTGAVTPVAESSTSITISYTVTNNLTHAIKAQGSIDISAVCPAATITNPSIDTVQVGEGNVTPGGYPIADAGQTTTWISSAPTIATVVSATGEITPIKSGTTTISYKITNTSTHAVIVKGSQTITVYSAAVVANPTISSVNLDAAPVIPTGFTPAVVGQTIAWTSSTLSIATIASGTGAITPVAVGDTTISYQVTDNTTHAIVAKGSKVATVVSTTALDFSGVAVDVAAGKITGTTTAMQYSLDSTDGSNGHWMTASSTNTSVTFVTGSVYVRQANKLSHTQLVATIAAAATAPALPYDDSANTINASTGLDSTYEYKIDSGAWTNGAITGDYTGTKTVLVRLKATVSALPSQTQTISFTL